MQDGIYDRFVPRFVQAVKDMKIGAGYDFGYDMGSLTSPDQVAVVTKHVEDAVSHGAQVLAGGKARPDLGPLFFEPTVLDGVTVVGRLLRRRDVRSAGVAVPVPRSSTTRSPAPTTRPTGSTPRCGRRA